jgi:hypothetical protein
MEKHLGEADYPINPLAIRAVGRIQIKIMKEIVFYV